MTSRTNWRRRIALLDDLQHPHRQTTSATRPFSVGGSSTAARRLRHNRRNNPAFLFTAQHQLIGAEAELGVALGPPRGQRAAPGS